MYDTIAAISSGLTESGIGIIRMSGPESRIIAEKIFTTKNGKSISFEVTNHVYYGFVHNVSRETSDEVLAFYMKAPHSYTGEDVVEIDCHGGVLMMKRVLESLIESGARPAEPGEFTKRAFLNGRIDLSQAEAVIDIINAKNDNAVKASVGQLKGTVSLKIREIRSEIINITAFIESALDDPEHYSLEGYTGTIRNNINNQIHAITKLIGSYSSGRLIKEGINTVILGKPNAGKSSLLNLFLGEERAIVTHIPGTTRDAIRESISAGNITLNLIDTAGIRETKDPVEAIGVQRSYNMALDADLILCVLDISVPFEEADNDVFKFIDSSSTPVLFLLNKSDLNEVISEKMIYHQLKNRRFEKENCMRISAKLGDGIDAIISRIEKLFSTGDISFNDQLAITSVRHLNLLKTARESLMSVIESIDNGLPEDFYTVDLMDAYKFLGEIIGEDVDDDLVNEIFSKFCMGK